MFLPYIFVLLIGCFVGVIEIASRHTVYRFAAVRSGPGVVYGAINGFVSILALAMIEYIMPSSMNSSIGVLQKCNCATSPESWRRSASSGRAQVFRPFASLASSVCRRSDKRSLQHRFRL